MASAPVPTLPRRRRSLAGPVILILLGVVFLLGNMHVLTWSALWVWFAHYWPLLLILWGVIKLVEYLLARQQGSQPAGIGFGGGLLVFMIVLFGITATALDQVDWGPIREHIISSGGPLPPFFGSKYQYDSQVDQAVAQHGEFRLSLPRGSITILPSADEKVHMSVHKTIVAYSKEEADRVDQATQPQFKSDEMPQSPALPNLKGLSPAERERIQGDMARAKAEANRARADAAKAHADVDRAREEMLRVNLEAPSGSFVMANVEIHVPPALALDLSTGRGDVEIRGRQGDVKLSTSHGDVTVEDVAGNVSISMHGGLHGGSLTARSVKGNVTVDGRANDSSISDVTGLVALSGDYMGETRLQNVAQGFRFSSSRTDLETGKIPGELRMDLHDLHASNVNGLKVHTRSKDIRLDDVVGDIEVSNKNADVEVHVSKALAGNIHLTNSNGGIELTLPAQAAFQVEANARQGEIRSDFGEIKIQNISEQNAVANGTVGSNGKKIQLSTEHADIEIRKAEQKSTENENKNENKKSGNSGKKSGDSDE